MTLTSLMIVLAASSAQSVVPPGTYARGADLEKTLADREVSVGDVVIIPAGTPHWYSDIDGSVTYLEIRYDPGSN